MQDGQQDGQQPHEPGWVYHPGDNTPQHDNTSAHPVTETPTAPSGDVPKDVYTPPQFVSQADEQQSAPVYTGTSDSPHIEWTASEYIANPKSAGWFSVLAIGSIVFAVAMYFLTEDLISTIVIGLLGIIVGIFAARQPQVLRYAISSRGIHIGDRFYPYGNFKSFSVADEQAIGYISLLPLKRFMPPLTIHYDPDDEDRIANTLAEYLPLEEHKRDVVDSITRRLRF